MDKEERDKRAAEGRDKKRTERQEYTARKKKIMKLEEKNYQYIYLVKSIGEGWYKIFGRSAIFYKEAMFPELTKRAKYSSLSEPNLQKDEDREFVSAIGFISIRSKARFLEYAKALTYEIIPEKDGILTVKFPQAFSKEKFIGFLDEDARKWEEVNKVLIPAAKFSTAAKAIREMTQRMYDFARKLKDDQKELVGKDIIKVASRALALHYAVERGYISVEEYFPKEKMLLIEIDSLLSMAFDARMTTQTTALRLAEKVDDALVAVEKTERKHKRNGV